MGNISKYLDQAMSEKKSSRRRMRGKTQRKNTHSSLGLTGPNFAFGRNFDKILPESLEISSSDSEQNLLIWIEFL